MALWPAWAHVSVELLDLDAFDDNGYPLSAAERGC
jgi:hypothetical protein